MAETAKSAGGDSIKVVARFRPQNPRELAESGSTCVDFLDSQSVRFEHKDYPGVYTFDRCFGLNSSQDDVFRFSALPIVEDVMRGYNGTIFAYGQTGSGKTHTMMGPDIDDGMAKGIIPRLVEAIFSQIEASPETLEFAIKVSFMEIYMERIRDLLNPANDNLPIHEEKGRGVFVKGMMEIYVGQISEVLDIMKRGLLNRAVAYTNMNEASSRSHSIFVITVQCKNTKDGSNRIGRLYLVDLAGSEKIKKTDVSGQTLEEAKKINKSLSSLGMVINALTDGKSSHIPYRDSKLTRILQESLGGNSKTTLVVCCSPSSFNDMETLSSLRFGMRAKTIKNKARVNAELSPAELKAALKKAKGELDSFRSYAGLLEGELGVWRSGGQVPPERFAILGARPDGISDTASAVSGVGGEAAARTEAQAVQDDEREEFLRRENELADQLAEKERELKLATRTLDQLKAELAAATARESRLLEENKDGSSQVAALRIRLEQAEFNAREANINTDSLREQVEDLVGENEELKKQIATAHATQSSANDLEREKKRLATIGKIMSELSPDASINEREMQIKSALENLGGDAGDVEALSGPFEELRGKLTQAEARVAEEQRRTEEALRQLRTTEESLARLGEEYATLLEKKIAQESEDNETASTLQELTAKLEAQFKNKLERRESEIETFQKELMRKEDALSSLQEQLHTEREAGATLRATVEQLKAGARELIPEDLQRKEMELERIRKQMAQQLADFDNMKKKLMQNLQQRVDKVIEMEISLDETREQYNNVIRSASTKEQQRKMTFLERNLEQLMSVQKELVDQNTNLKKEVLVAERKLAARNERIQTLEGLLIDAQEKFRTQQGRFEAELGVLRRQLQDAVEALEMERTVAQHGGFLQGSGRIAKPLRGGARSTAALMGDDEIIANAGLENGSSSNSSWSGSLANLVVPNVTRSGSMGSIPVPVPGSGSGAGAGATGTSAENRRSWFWGGSGR